VPEIDVTIDDLLAVLDAAGSKRAVVFATDFTGYLGAHFAASHPDRTTGLVLESPLMATHRTQDIPWGLTDEWYERLIDDIRADWGTPRWRPSEGQDAVEREWYPLWQRASVAPGALIAECHRRFDFSGVLSSIHVPTLVIADADAAGLMTPENARYVAQRIPGAELVELHRNHAQLPWYDGAEEIISEIGRFVSGIQERQSTFDRLLATVLFTTTVVNTNSKASPTLGACTPPPDIRAEASPPISPSRPISPCSASRSEQPMARSTGTFAGPQLQSLSEPSPGGYARSASDDSVEGSLPGRGSLVSAA
jgi:hypothetical protein